MGSWNTTDALTQLPILYGDKIRCFVIKQQPYEIDLNGTCYSNDLWAPIGPSITGIYNDYGSIGKIEKSLNSEILLDTFRNSNLDIKTDKFDDEVNLKTSNLETLLNCVERGRIKSKEYTVANNSLHLGLMFVLEETYQTMLSFNPVDTCRFEHSGGGYYYAPISKSFKPIIEEWYELHFNLFKALKNKFEHHFLGGKLFWQFRSYGLDAFKPALIELIKKETPMSDHQVQNIFKNMIEMMHFDFSMSSGRKMYQPQTGSGSQNDETSIHVALANATLAVVEKRKKEREEDEEDWEKPDDEGYMPYMRKHNKLLILK